jgi:hypothetical protein
MPRRACPVLTGWAGMNAVFPKPYRPDILVRQFAFSPRLESLGYP